MECHGLSLKICERHAPGNFLPLDLKMPIFNVFIEGNIMRSCTHCTETRCFIHAETLGFALRYTKANMHVDSIRGDHAAICPECDAYVLMLDFTWGVPIYSPRDLTVITVHDHGAVNETAVLDFGNLPFTIRAIEGALQMRKLAPRRQTERADSDGIPPLERNLLGPTGIPDDDSAKAEWIDQLGRLSSTLVEKPALPLLDAAIRTVIEQVPSSKTLK